MLQEEVVVVDVVDEEEKKRVSERKYSNRGVVRGGGRRGEHVFLPLLPLL